MSFSKRLHDARKAKRLTLDDLSILAGSAKSHIWALENKENPNPSAKLVNDLAKVLGVTVGHLIDDEPSDDDYVFFREYSALSPEAKRQMQRIVKVISD